MSEQHSLPIATHPDGGAELPVVLHLRWEDVAALGREAARLAAQLQRPVSLDEAASQKLSARRTTTSTTSSKDRTETTSTSSRMALASSAPTEPAAQWSSGSASSATTTTRGPFDPPTKISPLPSSNVEPGRATG